MRIDVLTLFPEMFPGPLGASILRRAAQPIADAKFPSGIRPAVASYHVHNLRDWSADARHQKVDAPPYGGGPGMVLQCQPVYDAVTAITALDAAPPLRILTTPQGQPLTQPLCEALARQKRLLIIAGHYEGLDERVIDRLRELPYSPSTAESARSDAAAKLPGAGGLLEISVGDYVLSGGELPALTLIDAVVRLLPGALGHAESAVQDSFSAGVERLLDHPHYAKPPEWDGRAVPEVLRSGDHARIAAWRAAQSLERTRQRRPDLLGAGNAQAKPTLVTLREAVDADLPAMLDLIGRTFATDAETKLTRQLHADGDALFSVLAEARGRLVGLALVTAAHPAAEPSRRGWLNLGPVAVDPLWHRQGIGSAMVDQAIRLGREARAAAMFVHGEPGFYRLLGFESAASAGFTREHARGGNALQFIHLRPHIALDPGPVRYARAFDSFPH